VNILRKSGYYLREALYWCSRILTAVGMIVLLAMVLLLVSDITSRRVFNSPFPWSLETVKVMLVVVVAPAISFCAIQGGHISIDLVTSRFPVKIRRVVYAFIYLLSVVLFSTMAWGSYTYGLSIWEAHRITGVLPIPIGPFILLVALGSLLLALVLLVQFINTLCNKDT